MSNRMNNLKGFTFNAFIQQRVSLLSAVFLRAYELFITGKPCSTSTSGTTTALID